jgi:hypothetical protein
MIEIMGALGIVALLAALIGHFVLLGWLLKQAQAEDRSCAGENGYTGI